jgi:hypothetical protein
MGIEATSEADLRIVEALEDYQRKSLEVLLGNGGNPEAAVKGLIDLHIEWTAGDPDLARLVSAGRHGAMAGPLGPRLRESNGRWMGELRDWLDRERKSSQLPIGSIAILHAVVFAPTPEISKLWLAGLLPRDLEDYRRPLAEAAWAGITAAGN